MGCVAAPLVELPVLGGGLTIAAPLPTFSGDLALCCKIAAFTTPPIAPILGTISGEALTAIILGLNANLALVKAYLDALIPPCPKDP